VKGKEENKNGRKTENNSDEEERITNAKLHGYERDTGQIMLRDSSVILI
jgi:hypothetical protein